MRFFPGATSLLKGATFIEFWFLKNFLRIFNFLFFWLCIKESNYLLFQRGLRLFKGLCLLFLTNVPGATFIPESRVGQGYPQIMADQLIQLWPNFYISSNLIWTSFIQIINLTSSDSSWSFSVLIFFDPIWTNLIQFYLIWTKLSIWPNLNQFEPISSDLNFQKWATNNKHYKWLEA